MNDVVLMSSVIGLRKSIGEGGDKIYQNNYLHVGQSPWLLDTTPKMIHEHESYTFTVGVLSVFMNDSGSTMERLGYFRTNLFKNSNIKRDWQHQTKISTSLRRAQPLPQANRNVLTISAWCCVIVLGEAHTVKIEFAHVL